MSRREVPSNPFIPNSFSAALRIFAFVSTEPEVAVEIIRMFKAYDCFIQKSKPFSGGVDCKCASLQADLPRCLWPECGSRQYGERGVHERILCLARPTTRTKW